MINEVTISQENNSNIESNTVDRVSKSWWAKSREFVVQNPLAIGIQFTGFMCAIALITAGGVEINRGNNTLEPLLDGGFGVYGLSCLISGGMIARNVYVIRNFQNIPDFIKKHTIATISFIFAIVIGGALFFTGLAADLKGNEELEPLMDTGLVVFDALCTVGILSMMQTRWRLIKED